MSDSGVVPPEARIFGTFDQLGAAQQRDVVAYLGAAWQAQVGRDIGSLEVDLSALEDLYAPALQAKRLRTMADRLTPIPGRRPHIDRSLFIPVDAIRGFVTAEGRALLEVAGSEHGTHAATPSMLARLVEFYAAPRREWMVQAFVGGDLRPATLGFLVFLLINNSTSASRGLTVPAPSTDEQRLADAVIPVVNAFGTSIGGQPLKGRERERISGNWAVTESRRQMPGIVFHEGSKRVERIYIGDGKEHDAIAGVARALGQRRGFSPEHLDSAFDAATLAYSVQRPLLKSWGLSWETEQHTGAVREHLADAMRRQAGTPGP